ncbi:HNH endonuclease [Mycobacterium sp. G7A2]|uniref:HNH endonuclease n=1 Tax=Mycobacterium sp. G7A2 TaxID=3317307 RepID=UPI0035A89F3E
MPSAPPRVCGRCGATTPKGARCGCIKPWEGATRRSGGGRWRKLRAAKLRANPICQWPGCRRPATEVDHIKPLAEGGREFDWENLQSLCHEHHLAKTAADARRGKYRPR